MFVHHIDPVIGTVLGVHLWWYGLSYSLGFLNAHLFLRRRRLELGLSLRSIYTLTLLVGIGVLVGGRAVVVNNEWAFYRHHRSLIPAVWMGGLATHGLIIGGATAVWLYSVIARRPVRPLVDVLAVAAALILGFGRIGNFIDGQIVGRVTGVAWAVKFPDADGFRHPVVLYDGLKNFLIVPILLWVGGSRAPAGRTAAWFLVLYAVPRVFIDLLRDYPLTLWGLPSGQLFNIGMAIAGAVLLLKSHVRPGRSGVPSRQPEAAPGWRRPAFALLLISVLVIPSDATRDVPVRYGSRHAGLEHSRIYPALPELR